MNENPEKLFLTDDRPVLPSLSRDLLQQALHEVSSVQEVKEEPGIYNRMEQILVSQEVSLGDISAIQRSEAGSVDKVKVEPLPPGLVDSMILIPTLQSDGTLAYAVQPSAPLQSRQGPVNTSSSVICSSQASPSKLHHHVPLLRTNKPKNILPKTCQPPAPVSTPTTPNTITQIIAPVQPQAFAPRVTASVAKVVPSPGRTVVRKLQIRRSDGQTKTVELSCRGTEVNIRSEQPLTQLELQHVQSVMRQGQQQAQQVYRLVTPSQQVNSFDLVSLEEDQTPHKDQDKEHFSVAAFVREFSKGRGTGKKHSRGRPRKGMSKINEKKVITELRREFGIRYPIFETFPIIITPF